MASNIQNKKEFYETLRKAKLFIACKREESGNISLQLLTNNKGQQMIPAFFTKQSKTGNFDEENLVEIPFEQLRGILTELTNGIDGVVIEPFDKNIILDRNALSEYDSFTQGMTVTKQDHSESTSYYPATHLQNDMKIKIAEFLRTQIGVNAAWALFSKNENEKMPHLTFAVDFFGSKFDLFPKLAEVIKPFMRQGQSFELTEKNPNMQAALGMENCLYVRESSVKTKS